MCLLSQCFWQFYDFAHALRLRQKEGIVNSNTGLCHRILPTPPLANSAAAKDSFATKLANEIAIIERRANREITEQRVFGLTRIRVLQTTFNVLHVDGVQVVEREQVDFSLFGQNSRNPDVIDPKEGFKSCRLD